MSCGAADSSPGEALRFCDLTLSEPALNIALDEALLECVERDGPAAETLRIWEPARPLVVVGRSSRVEEEVDLPACRRLEIPVLRRTSGGAAIVAGPGCLMYSVTLSYAARGALRAVDQAHCFVLNALARALRSLGQPVEICGTSDLAVGDKKFSGNSLRSRRNALLYHGTLLYDFPLGLVAQCLRTPPRQPAYRAGRPHGEFIANLPVGHDALVAALREAWQADRPLADPPLELAEQLAEAQFRHDAWNARH